MSDQINSTLTETVAKSDVVSSIATMIENKDIAPKDTVVSALADLAETSITKRVGYTALAVGTVYFGFKLYTHLTKGNG